MKSYRRLSFVIVMTLVCMVMLTSCSSFYELFVDDTQGEEGVYHAIYDDTNTDEEIAAIPDVHFMAGDLRNEIKTYGLTYEITLAFDTETESDATLSCYYYHNRNDKEADDYCGIGMIFIGNYTMEGDKITFHIESESYNVAIYEVGSDYAGSEAFQQFSYAEDKGNGVWAYQSVPYEYESTAEVLADILNDVPETVEFTVSGSKIVTWEAIE